jgi:hypothetical protein
MYGGSGNIAAPAVVGAGALAYTGVAGLPWIVGGGVALVVGGIFLVRLVSRRVRGSGA